MDIERILKNESIADSLFEMFEEEENLTEEKLRTVTELTVRKAEDLEALAAFDQLTSLHLYDCRCESYAPISMLRRLKTLDVLKCDASILSFVGECTALEDLAAWDCDITDISPLAKLTKLKKLDLSFNQITDLSPLAALTELREVDLISNPIKRIAPLRHKPRLKVLKIDTASIEDKRFLADPFICRSITESIDYPETFPQEWERQQGKKRRRPGVKVLAELHSRVHFCGNALLVSVKDGMNRMVSRKDVSKGARQDQYELFCDDRALVRFDIDCCPTCASFLHNGYGDSIMSLEECEAVRDRINGAYTNIHDAVENMGPILGLFKSGLYVVAEFELFPWHNDFFWNGSEAVMQDYSYNNCRTPNSAVRDYTDSPLYIYPTQRAELLNPERVSYYTSRMGEGESFPYAIAMYLVGGYRLAA